MLEKQELRKLITDISKQLVDKDYIDKLLYIFTLIFLKVTSDTWNFKKNEYEKKYPNNSQRVERLMRNQPIIISLDWSVIYKESFYPQVDSFLHNYLEILEKENACLRDIFFDMDWNQIEYRTLKKIIDKLNNFSFAIKEEIDNDLLAEVIDEVLMENKWGGDLVKGNAGTDFTSKSVTELIAQLANVKENEKVADLVCGSGGLLIQAASKVKDKKCQIYGQDNNEKVLQFCRLNMILHGIYDAKLRKENTILKYDFEEKFDVIIANPPFSVQNSLKKIIEEEPDIYYRRGGYPYGIPPASKADYAFIQNMLQSLKSNGRMFSLIALGALSRTGAEEHIRINMVKDNVVDTIILLPPNLFKNTLIKTCIMIFSKNKVQSDILFIDASNEYEKGKLQNEITNKNIDNILQLYYNRKTVEGISYVATQQEVLKNNGNLSVSKYVEIKKEQEKVNLEQLRIQINDVEEQLKILKDKKEFYIKKLETIKL